MEAIIKGRDKMDSSVKPLISPLKKVLTAFFQAWKSAYEALQNGQLPEREPLEKARKELMQALANASEATELPLLQRFLRTDAVELLSALKTHGITADAIQERVSPHLSALEKATEESEALLLGDTEDSFWENIV